MSAPTAPPTASNVTSVLDNPYNLYEWSLLPFFLFGIMIFVSVVGVKYTRFKQSAWAVYLKRLRADPKASRAQRFFANNMLYGIVWFILILHLCVAIWMQLLQLSTGNLPFNFWSGTQWSYWLIVYVLTIICVVLIPLWSRLFQGRSIKSINGAGGQIAYLLIFLACSVTALAVSLLSYGPITDAYTATPAYYRAYQMQIFINFTFAALSAWCCIALIGVIVFVTNDGLMSNPPANGASNLEDVRNESGDAVAPVGSSYRGGSGGGLHARLSEFRKRSKNT